MNLYKLLVLKLFLFSNTIYSQSIDSIVNYNYNYKLSKIDSIIKNQKSKNSLKWLALIPQISYGNNFLSDRKTINATISLNPLITYITDKNKEKIELKNLEIKLKEKALEDFKNNQSILTELHLDSLKIKQSDDIKKIYDQKKIIIENQYKNDEINVLDYLNFLENYTNKINALEELKLKYNIKLIKFKNLLNYEK